jgi:hypothetical protein
MSHHTGEDVCLRRAQDVSIIRCECEIIIQMITKQHVLRINMALDVVLFYKYVKTCIISRHVLHVKLCPRTKSAHRFRSLNDPHHGYCGVPIVCGRALKLGADYQSVLHARVSVWYETLVNPMSKVY